MTGQKKGPLRELVKANQEAASVFDSLPVPKDGAKEWEEAMSGMEANFPSEILEIDESEMVVQSTNGSRFIKVVKRFLKRS